MKVGVILGTRPEIIKMAPVIRQLQEDNDNLDHFVIHTGQHYSYNMDKMFFNELNLPDCKHNLEVGSGTHGEITARIVERAEKKLMEEKPDVVLVQGDTNSVLAGALAASKLGIKIGHVEAGLRSYDRTMPEETNRVLTDHMSDYLFVPTEDSRKILIGEGISEDKIFVTGNTIVDAAKQGYELAKEKSNITKKLGIEGKPYFLVTTHRQENVDNEVKLRNIFQALETLSKKAVIVYPIHPRTKDRMEKMGITAKGNIIMTEPLGYLDFLKLMGGADLVLSDSGGVQEESCILHVPCVTLRENTDRPESIQVGASVLSGTDPKKIIECAELMLKSKRDWVQPFGDGSAAKKIKDIIVSEHKKKN